MPWDYREAFDGVLRAIKDGRISEAWLDESVLRILKLKYRNFEMEATANADGKN